MTLEQRKQNLVERFNALKTEKEKHEAQINEINAELIRLQGAYREIESILKDQST